MSFDLNPITGKLDKVQSKKQLQENILNSILIKLVEDGDLFISSVLTDESNVLYDEV
jgi:ribosomal 50S subunit-associated protein YjgA (DUF615 family)